MYSSQLLGFETKGDKITKGLRELYFNPLSALLSVIVTKYEKQDIVVLTLSPPVPLKL